MAVSCRRRIQALWSDEHRSNAWAYVAGAGWRKLDDRSDDACTNLLVLAAQAKAENALVKIREELRGDRWFITEIYDLAPGRGPVAQEISFAVSECKFGWTAAFRQAATTISARVRLDPDADVSSSLLEEVKRRWKRGIENKWSYRFACCGHPVLHFALCPGLSGRMGHLQPPPGRAREEGRWEEQPQPVAHR